MRVGDVIADRFEVRAQVGAGGMGTVFRGHDRLHDRAVAIKIVMHDFDADRFFTEAAILAELSHPRIVRHVDHGTTTQGKHYLVMEWVEGKTVTSWIFRKRPSVDDTLILAMGIAEALEAVSLRAGVRATPPVPLSEQGRARS